MKTLSSSMRVFAGMAGGLVLVKLALTLWPGVFRSPAQAAVFEWRWLALWIALGTLGVLLSERTGFPAAWQSGTLRGRVLAPALWGAGFGVLAILTDQATGWTRFVAAKLGIATIHVLFPASLLVYPGGAVIVEILYRLFPIPLILWLWLKISHGRGGDRAFWVLAILTSFLEPLGDLGLRPLGLLVMAAVFVQDYALNLAQAVFFRRRGFLAAVLLRVAFYLIWHVLWGLAGRG